MGMFTRVSGKGQVVLPKSLRDLKAWPAGTDLEVVNAGEGVLLRPRSSVKKLTVEEAATKLRAIYTHHGSPIPVEKLSWHPEIDDAL